jgi:hypothetical protein
VFRVVGESLFKEKLLFSRREHEHHTTTDALNISVNKSHKSPKLRRFREGSTGAQQFFCENWMSAKHRKSFKLESMFDTQQSGI